MNSVNNKKGNRHFYCAGSGESVSLSELSNVICETSYILEAVQNIVTGHLEECSIEDKGTMLVIDAGLELANKRLMKILPDSSIFKDEGENT